MGSLIAELRRRNVIRMAGLYLVAAWLVVQVVGTVLPMFGAPAWVARTVVVGLAIGLIPALALSWAFELTAEGLRRDGEAPSGPAQTPNAGRRLDRLIILVLALALGWLVIDKFWFAPQSLPQEVAPAVSAAADASVAVLPFADMSQMKDQEYFSDGLSEELLNQLAQVPQLRVVARTSSFSFRGGNTSVAEIGRRLRVAHVLQGSVRKSGDSLRISAQLVRTSDSSQLWSQSFDRRPTDVFAVQDEIARAVVVALRVRLQPGEAMGHTQRTRNADAYEQYLVANRSQVVGGLQGLRQAMDAAERAVELDPRYANAHVALAFGQAGLANYAPSAGRREHLLEQALAHADRAIALAPDLAEAYAGRGSLRARARMDWSGAQDDFEKALALEPNHVLALFNQALLLFAFDRREEALAMARKATVIDPFSANAWGIYGRLLAASGDAAGARKALERSLALNPAHDASNYLLGTLDLAEGDTEGALALFSRTPGPFGLAGSAMVEHTRGGDAAARRALAALEADYGIGFALQIAEVHAWRGDKDQAFAWLERALAVRDTGLSRVPFEPGLDPLRDDPRFALLLRRLRLPLAASDRAPARATH